MDAPLPATEESCVVTALIHKRAMFIDELEAVHFKTRQLIIIDLIDLDRVDATIRRYKPDIDLEEINPTPLPPRHQAFRDQPSRFILEVLKPHPEGMTTRGLAKLVIEDRGLNPEDKRIGASLNQGHAEDGAGAVRAGACIV